MINDKDIVSVTNRSGGILSYEVPDLRIKRFFTLNETKKVTAEEVRKLSYVQGGISLIKNNLIINNQELINEILYNVEPEYFYTRDEVKELLLNGSIEQLEDCLNFAPEGVLTLVKQIAIEIKLSDMNKRKLIQEKMNVDITGAIMIDEENKKDDEPTEEVQAVRKAAPIKKAETPTRKYNVVNNK